MPMVIGSNLVGMMTGNPIAITYTTTGITLPTYMFAADGAWIQGSDTGNNQTEDNWLLFVESASTYGRYHPYAFNTTTKQIAVTGAAWTQNTGSGAGYNQPVQLSHDLILNSYRYYEEGIAGKTRMYDINAGLTAFDNDVVGQTQAEHYASSRRAGDNHGYTFAGSNGPQVGYRMYNYTGGASFTSSTKLDGMSAAGEAAQAALAAQYTTNVQTMIGGGSAAKARAANNKEFVYLNNNDTATWGGTTTPVDVNTITWSGVDGAALIKAETADAFTLPSHAGSTEGPQMVATSWGNIVIHLDNATPANSVVFPMTWSGTTPTVGSSTAFAGAAALPSHEIQWSGIDGYGLANSSKHSCGEKPGAPDVYNTFRMYASGADMKLDTVEVDFSHSSGAHSITLKQQAVYTFASSSSSSLSFFFPSNGTDLALFHSDTDVFVYIENAYY